MQPEANPWSRQTAPFRQMMYHFTRPAGGLFVELDALDAWCTQLVEPTLPGVATLDSPFAGLQPPELPAPLHPATTSAAGGATPANTGSPPSHRAQAAPPTASGPRPSGMDAGSGVRPLTAPGAHPPAAFGMPLSSGTGPVFPVRSGKMAHPANVPPRIHATSRVAETQPASDRSRPSAHTAGATARPSQTGDSLPRQPAALDAPQTMADRDPSQPTLAQAASSAPASAVDAPLAPIATAAAGLQLLAALTASLYGRGSAAKAGTAEPTDSAAPHRPSFGAMPWRAPDPRSPLYLPVAPQPMPGAPNSILSVPAANSALDAPALPDAQPVMRRAPWPLAAQPPSAPLDPDLLADLVNEALVEQARRHGANLP